MPRHVIKPEHRHTFTPDTRGHRPRVSPGEPTRIYRVCVGDRLYRLLRASGADTVRRWLMALMRFKP